VYLQVPSGLGTNGAATNATTTVFVLETVPSGGLQASIKATTEFQNFQNGKGGYQPVQAATPKVKGKGTES
jgi:hypothetical protein